MVECSRYVFFLPLPVSDIFLRLIQCLQSLLGTSFSVHQLPSSNITPISAPIDLLGSREVMASSLVSTSVSTADSLYQAHTSYRVPSFRYFLKNPPPLPPCMWLLFPRLSVSCLSVCLSVSMFSSWPNTLLWVQSKTQCELCQGSQFHR